MSCSDLQNLDEINTNIVSLKKKSAGKTIRCDHIECKKKIEMMKFTCKCGLSFCIKHKNSYRR